MESRLKITFNEGYFKLSELEDKINFLKSLPIEINPPQEEMEVFLHPAGNSIYPLKNVNVEYNLMKELEDSNFQKGPVLSTLLRHKKNSNEYYMFHSLKRK